VVQVDGAFGTISVRELSGLSLPDAQPGSPEFFHRLSLVSRRSRAEQLIASAEANAGAAWRAPLAAVKALFEAVGPQQLAQALDHPLVHSQIRLQDQPGDGALYGSGADAAVGLARYFVGRAEFDFVLPAQAFRSGSFLLPHQNVLLRADGPVALRSRQDCVELTWNSGERVTMPTDGLMPGVQHDLLESLPRVKGLPVLNGAAEVCAPLADLLEVGQNRGPLAEARALAEGWRPSDSDLGIFEAGLDLLQELWPQAAATHLRTFGAIVAVPHRHDGHFLSLTTGRLRAGLVAGLVTPVQVADSLMHEGAHNRLWPVFEFDPLIAGPDSAAHPSPWRKDPRPLKGLLNGVHAFANVCLYYQRLAAAVPEARQLAEQKLEFHRPRVQQAWRYLSTHAEPTALGALLFSQLEDVVAGV